MYGYNVYEGWIPVNEYKPPREVGVLCWHRYRGFVILRRPKLKGFWVDTHGLLECLDTEVSHWMPLPEIPSLQCSEKYDRMKGLLQRGFRYELLKIPILHLETSVRVVNALSKKYKYLGEVLLESRADLMRIKNFGRKSFSDLNETLRGFGVCWGRIDDEWVLL